MNIQPRYLTSHTYKDRSQEQLARPEGSQGAVSDVGVIHRHVYGPVVTEIFVSVLDYGTFLKGEAEHRSSS